jgi:hypothetical protein
VHGAGIVAAVLGALYLSIPSARFTFDGTVFALWLLQERTHGELGVSLHMHHVLYGPLAYLLASVLDGLGIDVARVALLQLLDALCMALAAHQVVRLAHDVTGDREVSLVAGGWLGLCWGTWFYALEPEVYALQTLAWVVALRVMHRVVWGPSEVPAWRRGLVLAAVAVLNVLSHLSSGVVWLALGMAAAWRGWPGGPRRWLGRDALVGGLTFTVATVAGALGAYRVAYAYVQPPPTGSFLRWVLGSALPMTERGYELNVWSTSLRALPDSLEGYGAALLAAGRWALETSVSTQVARVVLLVAVVALLVRGVASMVSERDPTTRAWHGLLAVALVPMAVFSTVMEPWNIEYKVVQLPGIALVVAVGGAAARRAARSNRVRGAWLAGLVVLALGTGAHNAWVAALPGADTARNEDLQRAWFIRDNTPEGARVYLSGSQAGYNMGKAYIPYFGGRVARAIDLVLHRARFPLPVLAGFAEDGPHGVYILSELLEPGPAVSALEKNHGVDAGAILSFFRGLPLEKVAERPDGFALYRLATGPSPAHPGD